MVTIPTIDMVKTGQHITELRVQAGLSVRQLQEIFGFSYAAGTIQMAAWNSIANH